MILEYRIAHKPGGLKMLGSYLSPEENRSFVWVTIFLGARTFPNVKSPKGEVEKRLKVEITGLWHDEHNNYLRFEGLVRPETGYAGAGKTKVVGCIWLHELVPSWLRVCDEHEETGKGTRIAEPVQELMIKRARALAGELTDQAWLGEAIIRRIVDEFRVLADVPPDYTPPR